jgi:hypothetical protein
MDYLIHSSKRSRSISRRIFVETFDASLQLLQKTGGLCRADAVERSTLGSSCSVVGSVNLLTSHFKKKELFDHDNSLAPEFLLVWSVFSPLRDHIFFVEKSLRFTDEKLLPCHSMFGERMRDFYLSAAERNFLMPC